MLGQNLYALVFVALICDFTAAYPPFQRLIPNGAVVPHPCDRSLNWPGVGHRNPAGGGPRNPFGLDFDAEGFTWTVSLCKKDSDGDGMTNGQELGDPDCVWSTGATPALTDLAHITHPGVCEPITSNLCMVLNLAFLSQIDICAEAIAGNATEETTTSSPTAWCPAAYQPGVQTFDFLFNNASVSTNETTYLCVYDQFPGDQDYEIIAWEAIVDQKNYVHHMVLFTCDASFNATEDIDRTSKVPDSCFMSVQDCSDLQIGWTFGQGPICFSSDVGLSFGPSSFSQAVLQIHYNNPLHDSGLIDNSGIRFYYTTKSRPNNLSGMLIGQMTLVLPPNLPQTYAMGSGFGGDCSNQMLSGVDQYKIVSMLFHSHTLGNTGKVTITSNSTGRTQTLIEGPVSYTKPPMIFWPEGSEPTFQPGDSFSVECGYNTSMKRTYTFFGESTEDEMCIAYFQIYPAPPMANGVQLYGFDYGDLNVCDFIGVEFECNAMMAQNMKEVKTGLKDACQCSIVEATSCAPSCLSYLQTLGVFNSTEMSSCFQSSALSAWFPGRNAAPAQTYGLTSHVQQCLDGNMGKSCSD